MVRRLIASLEEAAGGIGAVAKLAGHPGT